MLDLKKIAIAVLAFGSGAIFAGTMGPACALESGTVPCEQSAWGFGGQALYLEASVSNLAYLGDSVTNGTDRYQRTNFKWGWGYKLEGFYHFSTGNDLNLNWSHWTRSASITLPGTYLSPVAPAGSTVVFGILPEWDAVNLEFGQQVNFAERENIRFHAGVEYGRLTGRTYTDFTTPTTGGIVSQTRDLYPIYNGFGPRVGADMSHNLANGFTMYANVATAILVGTAGFTVTSDLMPSTPGTTTHVAGSATEFVPEVEVKLGASYIYKMVQGDLSVDLGWMWINYFNGIHEGLGASVPVKVSDFALQGPFVALKWVGYVV